MYVTKLTHLISHHSGNDEQEMTRLKYLFYVETPSL